MEWWRQRCEFTHTWIQRRRIRNNLASDFTLGAVLWDFVHVGFCCNPVIVIYWLDYNTWWCFLAHLFIQSHKKCIHSKEQGSLHATLVSVYTYIFSDVTKWSMISSTLEHNAQVSLCIIVYPRFGSSLRFISAVFPRRSLTSSPLLFVTWGILKERHSLSHRHAFTMTHKKPKTFYGQYMKNDSHCSYL